MYSSFSWPGALEVEAVERLVVHDEQRRDVPVALVEQRPAHDPVVEVADDVEHGHRHVAAGREDALELVRVVDDDRIEAPLAQLLGDRLTFVRRQQERDGGGARHGCHA